MKDLLYIYGLLKEGVYRIGFYYFSKKKRIAYQKVEVISKQYGIIKPEELIKYVKYFAKTEESWGFNWEGEINKHSNDPNIVLVDVMDKIRNKTHCILYLQWLINELPKYPVPGTGNVSQLASYRDFKQFAVQEYKACKQNDPLNKFTQEAIKLIKEFAAVYEEGNDCKRENCIVYLAEWFKVLSFHNSRSRAIENAKKKREELENVSYQVFRRWDEKFRKYYEARTGKKLSKVKKSEKKI